MEDRYLTKLVEEIDASHELFKYGIGHDYKEIAWTMKQIRCGRCSASFLHKLTQPAEIVGYLNPFGQGFWIMAGLASAGRVAGLEFIKLRFLQVFDLARELAIARSRKMLSDAEKELVEARIKAGQLILDFV